MKVQCSFIAIRIHSSVAYSLVGSSTRLARLLEIFSLDLRLARFQLGSLGGSSQPWTGLPLKSGSLRHGIALKGTSAPGACPWSGRPLKSTSLRQGSAFKGMSAPGACPWTELTVPLKALPRVRGTLLRGRQLLGRAPGQGTPLKALPCVRGALLRGRQLLGHAPGQGVPLKALPCVRGAFLRGRQLLGHAPAQGAP